MFGHNQGNNMGKFIVNMIVFALGVLLFMMAYNLFYKWLIG